MAAVYIRMLRDPAHSTGRNDSYYSLFKMNMRANVYQGFIWGGLGSPPRILE